MEFFDTVMYSCELVPDQEEEVDFMVSKIHRCTECFLFSYVYYIFVLFFLMLF